MLHTSDCGSMYLLVQGIEVEGAVPSVIEENSQRAGENFWCPLQLLLGNGICHIHSHLSGQSMSCGWPRVNEEAAYTASSMGTVRLRARARAQDHQIKCW